MTQSSVSKSQDQRTALRRARSRAAKQMVDLLEDASGYLRRSASPAIRISTALLLAASLAACEDAEPAPDVAPEPVVAALSSEVRQGLPTSPGRYDVVPESVHRSDQGVYAFAWRDAQQRVHQASVSQLKLAEGQQAQLEVPGSGDPVLRLPPGVPVRVYSSAAAPEAAATPTATASRSYVGHSYGPVAYWHPFFIPVGSSRTVDYSTPQYHNPPATTINAGDTINGSRASTSAPPPSARVTGLRTAVSGRAGGTGSGTAASGKSTSSSTSRVSSPSSSGFSGGKGGSSVGSSSS